MAYDYDTDYSKELDTLLNQPNSWDNYSKLKKLNEARNEKIKANPSLQQYQGNYEDLIMQYGRPLHDAEHAGEPRGGGMGSTARREFESIVNQSPGWEGTVLDGYTNVSDMQKDYGIQSQGTQEPSMEELIRELQEAAKRQRISALDKSRNTALSNLSSEESRLHPLYYDARNRAAGTSDVSKMNFAQYMASRGIEGNAGAMPEIYRNVGLQNTLGGLKRDEAAARSDIERRRTGIQNAYQSDLAAAEAGADSDMLRMLIDQYNADRQYGLQEAGLTGQLGGQQTLAARGQEFDQALAVRNALAQEKQQELDNLYRQDVFDYNKSRDAVADTQWQQAMNLDLRKQSFTEAQKQIENSLAQRRITNDEAQQAIQWAKWEAEQDPDSLDNQIKRQTLENNDYLMGQQELNQAISQIDNLYTYEDPLTGAIQVNPETKQQLRNYILGLNLPDEQTDQLLLRYGLPINEVGSIKTVRPPTSLYK